MAQLPAMSPSREFSSELSFTGAAPDAFSHVASLSSTPPTTLEDTISLASDASKRDVAAAPPHHALANPAAPGDDPAQPSEPADASTPAQDALVATPALETPIATPTSERVRRQRASAPVYNLSKLSGTAGHGKRRSKGDVVVDRKRRSTARNSLASANADSSAIADISLVDPNQSIDVVEDTVEVDQSTPAPSSAPKSKASRKQKPEPPRRAGTRSNPSIVQDLTSKVASLGKRSRKVFERDAVANLPRELRRLQDTNEFSGIDLKPVYHTVWANGKEVPIGGPEPPKKKAKAVEPPKEDASKKLSETPVEEAPLYKQPRFKKWLDRGLYAGQEAPLDIYKGLTPNEKRKLSTLPELTPSAKANKVLPSPMFNGLRMLIDGRDFKLPFDICHPLPPGQPKPAEYKKTTKNRFVGDAGAIWKKTPFKDYQSMCVCKEEDPCGDNCQNRVMLYECDKTNCKFEPDVCQNRAFTRLQERTKQGGKYRIGVEVVKTDEKGYGIRANRSFHANQIIMEYTGEIITEEECDRRMNEVYKDNKCYYLMSFDQNMIIDATRGSDARFVNHSCEPNCRMIKWIVSGQPRMALFAGDRDIMVGEELTYDYKFDPFSAKNVQKCLCGSPKCRGVLGPKPKEVKPPQEVKESKAVVKKTVKKGVTASKRKLGEMLGEKKTAPAKSRKTATPAKKTTKAAAKPAATAKRALPTTKLKAKGAKIVKRSVSTIAVNAKATTGKLSQVKKTYSKTTKVQTKLTAPKKGTKIVLATKAKGALPSPEADEAPVDVYSFSPPTPRRGLDLVR